LRPIWVIGLFEEGALVEGRDFWHSMVFFLKEGVTTRVCMIISLMICNYFSTKLFD
jgi:hypothetical protein